MSEKQRTLNGEVIVSGLGLHSGVKVNLTLKPAEENFGFQFCRVDLPNQPMIPALEKFVTSTDRGTTISKGDATVATVEHLLAAFIGTGLDNVLVEIDNAEVPIMDGSSMDFVEPIQKVGTKEQSAEREYFVLEQITHLKMENGVELIAVPAEEFSISTVIDFGASMLEVQQAELNHLDDFVEHIAAARTFVFLHELEMLVKHDLIKGGRLDNALVFINQHPGEKEIEKLTNYFNHEGEISVKENETLNDVQLRFDNEPVRHKLLDVIGDLALIGKRLKARVIAHRPGHKANVAFAGQILATQPKGQSPLKDIYAEPVVDIARIQELLPHRYPFLLIDKVMKLTDQEVIGVKNITINEPFFQGHFPGKPVMPGVLQLEAMAQVGGVLLLSQVPDPENYLTFFLKIDKVKFRNMVGPGDIVVFHLKLLSPIRRGICEMKGEAYVGDKLVSEGIMTAQILKQKKEDATG